MKIEITADYFLQLIPETESEKHYLGFIKQRLFNKSIPFKDTPCMAGIILQLPEPY